MEREHRPIGDGEILNVRQAAEFLGYTIEELYKLNSRIPHYKIGRTIKYRRSELNAWLLASE